MYLVSVRCIVAWLLSLVEQVIANWAAVSGGLVGLLDLFWGILVRHKRKVMEIGDVVRTTFQWTCVDLVETGQLLAITHWLKTFYTISVASRNTASSCLIFEGSKGTIIATHALHGFIKFDCSLQMWYCWGHCDIWYLHARMHSHSYKWYMVTWIRVLSINLRQPHDKWYNWNWNHTHLTSWNKHWNNHLISIMWISNNDQVTWHRCYTSKLYIYIYYI